MVIKEIIITRGLPNSGKTKFAKEWLEEDFINRIRINSDDLSKALYNENYDVRTLSVFNIKIQILKYSMSCLKDIVIDDMNLDDKEINQYNTIVNDFNEKNTNYNYEIKFKNFYVSLEECIRRDSYRVEPCGKQTIKLLYKKYSSFLSSLQHIEIFENQRRHDKNKEDCVVFDIDGTLCLNTSKRNWINSKDILNYSPNSNLIDLLNILSNKYKVFIVAGRYNNEYSIKYTKEWLDIHKVNYYDIYFKEDKRNYTNVEHKEESIKEIMNKYNVKLVFDNSDLAIEMYRKNGVLAMKPNESCFT